MLGSQLHEFLITGLRVSAEQVSLRWLPALGQTHVIDTQLLTAQVSQYLLNNQRIFDTGDDFHGTAAFTTRVDVDVEYAL